MYNFALQLKKLAVACFCPVISCICLITFGFLSTKVNSTEYVDIGIFYTEAARKHTAIVQIHEMVTKRTKIANQALVSAKVPLQRRIVAILPSPIVQSELLPLKSFLGKSQSYRAFLPDIERFGMDYITVLVHVADDQGCGFAQVGGRVAIVIVSNKCNKTQKDYLLAHEWGHLDGAAHKRQEYDIAKKHYGVGYVCQGRSTIMNMETRSNKKQYFYSQADNCGKQNVADVARMIKERMHEANAIGNIQSAMTPQGDVTLRLKTKVISERRDIHATLILNQAMAQKTSVELYAKGASKGSDFKPLIKRVSIERGIKRKPIVIPVQDDNRWEADETVIIELRYPEGLNLVNQIHKVVIVSDDGP